MFNLLRTTLFFNIISITPSFESILALKFLRLVIPVSNHC